MRKLLIGFIAVVGIGGMAACSPSTTNFKEDAEKFIESDKLKEEAGIGFTEAICEEPASTDIGTKYECTATGSDAVAYVLGIEITAKNELKIMEVNPA